MVFVLQLMVALSSCFLFARNLQVYFGKTNVPILLEWLKMWDGVGRREIQTIFRRPRSPYFMSWLTRNIFLPIASVTEWCSTHYDACLIISFVCEVLVFVITKRKWLSEESLNCLLWLILLVNYQQRSQRYILEFWLSCFVCAISLNSFMVTSVRVRLFGQKKKKKRKMLKMCTTEENESNGEIRGNTGRKLKLPDELMFADENHCLDENIGSLSLGPLERDKKRNIPGSWFGSYLSSRIVEPQMTTDKQPLIWPAKFHLDGTSLHSRKRQNEDLADFSDDDLYPLPQTYLRKRNGSKSRQDKTEEDGRVPRPKTLFYKRCNILVLVILACSLALNICFVLLLKDPVRKPAFKT